jgi:hypothetical protein
VIFLVGGQNKNMKSSCAKKIIQDCLMYFDLIFKSIETGKTEVQIERSRKLYIIRIDEVSEWIVCIKDFLTKLKNETVKDIFYKA